MRIRLKNAPKIIWLGGLLASLTTISALGAEWPKERVETYAISGTTGIALYQAIGEKGPKIGITRAIAHTRFDLKWRRNYTSDGSACTLSSVIPFLTVIYTLPKPSGTLPEPLRTRWDTFYAGIAAHEQVHGQMIRSMVEELAAATTGLRVKNDPQCKKIRDVVLEKVRSAYANYQSDSAAFDREDMAQGGNIHQLILTLVNGP